MKRVLLALVVVVVFAVLGFWAGVSEWRKKKALGAAYEGPLDDE